MTIFDDDENNISNTKITGDNRITKPFMTKYEMVRVIAERAKQLSLGAKPMLKNTSHLSSQEIAELELTSGKMPFKIERQLNNGLIEVWKVSELQIFK